MQQSMGGCNTQYTPEETLFSYILLVEQQKKFCIQDCDSSFRLESTFSHHANMLMFECCTASSQVGMFDNKAVVYVHVGLTEFRVYTSQQSVTSVMWLPSLSTFQHTQSILQYSGTNMISS